MVNTDELLAHCISLSNPEGFDDPRRGKVRDVYALPGDKLAIVSTDRISAYDHILGEPIPCKGQILNLMAAWSLRQVQDIVPVHLIEVPHPNITIAKKCSPIAVEVVVRGHLTGHAWRQYQKGLRSVSGAAMPDGLREFDPFPEPIITPTTKAEAGHDEDISAEQIVASGLISEPVWKKISQTALQLFERGRKIAASRGLILADTKYEFGFNGQTLTLIDEIHTPDSSRYFYQEGFDELRAAGKAPVQLSKEYIREWLRENGFTGQPGEVMPQLPDEIRLNVFQKYARLYEQITGEAFTPVITPDFDYTLAAVLNKFMA
ncbi:phosphoribosylaminoimidazole-succinocarboxamide synthase [Cyclonatronum proteinivorum]|uniref:Phosphoribosylaminoimidazole-succinocarboxamide synthase n=1 Tax=Cyclonatronum proteinivorum TaxID=1457365 RepID=A0A345ULJ8_9BACT|nr:phosphoribosylaminoimidazolesuccinocarboxamide synthase [Cyclonatronum proteinivorum]AXJ01350.1 phosphoribosylaminoimidazole-succinocarboxamide synthase [Cyclonatronum proteinivorum]